MSKPSEVIMSLFHPFANLAQQVFNIVVLVDIYKHAFAHIFVPSGLNLVIVAVIFAVKFLVVSSH